MESLNNIIEKKESKLSTALWISIFLLLTIGIFLFVLELGCLKYFGKPNPVTGFCSGTSGDTQGLKGLINRISNSLSFLIMLSPVTSIIWLGLFIGGIWKGSKIRKTISLIGLFIIVSAFVFALSS